MSNFLMRTVLKQVVPYLSKIGDGIKSIEKEYNVKKARIVIELKVVDGKEIPVMKFEGVNEDFTLKVLRIERIEGLLNLITGDKGKDEDESDE